MKKAIMKVSLLQLPIPQLPFGVKTGNIPLGGACLKLVSSGLPGVEVLPESLVSYLGDEALIRYILDRKPDILGFSVYSWNVKRSLYLAQRLKERHPVRVIFGGPEITSDNHLVQSQDVDFSVFGQGERIFQRLLCDQHFWGKRGATGKSDDLFRSSRSPYLAGLLEPEVEDLVLLETQRGCPYRCGYCYYNKACDKLTMAEEENLLTAIRWTVEAGIAELCLLDPSLNTRPHLKEFLKKVAQINKQGKLSLNSEIRAEAIDAELAGLFAACGFSYFEIGLQSTNPEALKIMNRPLDLNRFLAGVRLLKEHGIVPRIDLILGLPGDTLDGFKQSVDFLAAHDLTDDIQIFPLSVLPGTDFRLRSLELGLAFEQDPPYTVTAGPSFSGEDLLTGLDYAETALEVALYPMPDLDVSFRSQDSSPGAFGHHWVTLGHEKYLWKLMLPEACSHRELEDLAGRLTHPYQIFLRPQCCDYSFIRRALQVLTSMNPFTPFELIFLEPKDLPDPQSLLSDVRINRPHFLDIDLRYLYPQPGNRAMLFTLVSENRLFRFSGQMKRQIFWWKKATLPEREDLTSLEEMDGILIDAPVHEEALLAWQDRLASQAEDLPWISFADVAHERRWLKLTAPSRYFHCLFP
ncbi:MAG: B12-binding domain-containing radical SAM protein [bacterium]